jgi:hypothetical protein
MLEQISLKTVIITLKGTQHMVRHPQAKLCEVYNFGNIKTLLDRTQNKVQ